MPLPAASQLPAPQGGGYGAEPYATALNSIEFQQSLLIDEADFKGFECPDYFVVGYGMDVGHSFRQLPYVGVVVD
jgi:hypothetical protein